MILTLVWKSRTWLWVSLQSQARVQAMALFSVTLVITRFKNNLDKHNWIESIVSLKLQKKIK